MAVGANTQDLKPQDRPEGQAGWDREKAAQYLDARMDMWFEQATKLTTGEGKTSCVSCHTVVPHLFARPVLRRAMGVSQPTAQEVKLLAEITQRVESYGTHESLYGPKAGESRATEAVLNALLLALEDARQHRNQPSEVTRRAFRQLWETQRPDGAWDWLDLAEEPDESADAQYYGAALAALGAGTVPGLLGGGEGNATEHVENLRTYLTGRYAGQNLYNRAWMLLASTRLAGLLSPEQRDGLMAELERNQNDDGGWSLQKLGPWRWSKTTPPFSPPGHPDAALLAKSDGYATGLITYGLRQAGIPLDHPALKKAVAWLKRSQMEVQIGPQRWRCWRGHSLNHDRENGGERGEPWKRMVMSDPATAFAVLALLPPD
jgi:hypothetical protein